MREVQATRRVRTLSDSGQRGEGRLIVAIRPGQAAPLAEVYSRQIKDGKRTHTKLGNFPTLTLAQARDRHRALAPVIREGENIRHHLATMRQARRELGTLVELCEAYADHLARNGRRSAAEVRRCLVTAPNSAAKAMGGDRLACDIAPGDVAQWLRPIHREAPAAADQYRRWLSAAINHCIKSEHDYRAEPDRVRRWGLAGNVAAMVPADTQARRAGTRHLAPDELRAVLRWLADGSAGRTDARACQAMRLMAMTGQRVEMVLHLRAEQWDGEWLHWPSTKTGKPHGIPLPPQAALILHGLTPNPHGWFFPMPTNPAKPFRSKTLDYVCHRCADALGIPRFCPRDFRRTFTTLAADLAGLGAEEIARIQAHQWGSRVAERHYSRATHRELKTTAMHKWAAALNGLL